jgi:hypothetical protein
MRRWASLWALIAVTLLLGSCTARTPKVGTPFHSEQVTIPPGTAIGFPL